MFAVLIVFGECNYCQVDGEVCIIYSRKASGLVESERGGRGDREHTRKGTVRVGSDSTPEKI